MRIMTDIDGCLGDFNRLFADYLKLDSLPDPDRNDYWEASVWRQYIPDSEAFLRAYVDLVSNGKYLDEQLISLEAVKTLNRIHDDGHEIIVATDRKFRFLVGTDREWINDRAEEDTRTWLDKIGLKYDQLLLTPRKSDASANVYIEDSPTNIARLIEDGAENIILYSHAYNRNVVGASLDSCDWDEIYQYITSITK